MSIDLECQSERRHAGLSYPRICARCGLGPCHRGHGKTPFQKAPAAVPISPVTVTDPDGAPMPKEPAPKPELLRVPTHFRSVADVLGAAAQMDLPNVLVLSELADGKLVFLDSGLNMGECNWLLDRLKALMVAPHQPMRGGDGAA